MSRRNSRLLLDEEPLQVLPSLAKAIGINQAILLQQINYWIKNAEKSGDARKFKRERWWTYNSYPEWQKQLPWLSVAGIKKVIYKLEDLKLVYSVQINKQRNDHTKWYTVNYEAVEALLEDDGGVPQSSRSGDTEYQGGCPKVADRDGIQSSRSLTESPENNSEIPTGCEETSQTEEVIPFNKYLTNQFYDLLFEEKGVKKKAEYGFHLGRFGDMVDTYNPDVEFAERVVRRMVDRIGPNPKIDAMSAYEDVKLGRDTGEAWSGPAPWEAAQEERAKKSTLPEHEQWKEGYYDKMPVFRAQLEPEETEEDKAERMRRSNEKIAALLGKKPEAQSA